MLRLSSNPRPMDFRVLRRLRSITSTGMPLWNPGMRCPRLGFRIAVHRIDLFEIESRGFIVEEEHYDHRKEIASRENVAVAELDGRGDEGSEECKQKVPGPVSGGRERGGI